MSDAALPSELKLGLTTSQGLSIGALIGLMATKNGVALPLSSWGAGTRRMAALEIASATDKEASVTLIDEIERGLEPYRLRKLINILVGQQGQIFLTTHSPVAISCAEGAHLWYLDSQGSIGALPRDKIGPQQKRDPETFLARVAVIAEGPTEVGFLQYLLEKAFEGNPLDHGVRVCDGQELENDRVLWGGLLQLANHANVGTLEIMGSRDGWAGWKMAFSGGMYFWRRHHKGERRYLVSNNRTIEKVRIGNF